MRRLGGGLFLAALSGLLAIAAAEVAVRLLRPGLAAAPAVAENPFWRHDADLGWVHRPGQTGTFHREEFSHAVAINAMGFRDRERALPEHEAAPEPRRIAVLGDSFTWGHGVEDREIFTRLLEERLPGAELWNLGVSAYSTDQELLLYRRFGPSIRAGIVLLMVSRNDYEGNASEAYNAYRKPRFEKIGDRYEVTGLPVPAPGPLGRSLAQLRGWSAFLNGLWFLAVDADAVPGQRSGWEEQAAITSFLLAALAEEARKGGARFAVVSVPSNAHVYFPEVLESEWRKDALLASWTEGAKVPFLDLVPGFRAEWERTGIRLHYHQDKHWNAAGHALAAELLAVLLRERSILPIESAQ